MPLRQYFLWVGSVLLVALFAADWCLPPPVHARWADTPSRETGYLRIRSDHRWPEKVVFDTAHPGSMAVAEAEPVVAENQQLAQAGQSAPSDAFAAWPLRQPRQQETTRFGNPGKAADAKILHPFD